MSSSIVKSEIVFSPEFTQSRHLETAARKPPQKEDVVEDWWGGHVLQRSLHVEFCVGVALSGYEADEEALAEDNDDIPRTDARPDEVPETMAVVALAGSSSPISSALRSS